MFFKVVFCVVRGYIRQQFHRLRIIFRHMTYKCLDLQQSIKLKFHNLRGPIILKFPKKTLNATISIVEKHALNSTSTKGTNRDHLHQYINLVWNISFIMFIHVLGYCI